MHGATTVTVTPYNSIYYCYYYYHHMVDRRYT